MKKNYVILLIVCIISISTLFIASCSSSNDGGGTNTGGGGGGYVGSVDEFKAALEKDGFIVEEGSIGYIDIFKLCSEGVIESCFGNNASNPYLVLSLPRAPGEATSDKDAWIGTFQLRPDEAVVIVGKTPPKMGYYGYCPYLFKRWYDSDGDYRLIFASLSDSLNLTRIKTDGTPDGESGNPYNAQMMLITTADRGTDSKIRTAAGAAGYSDSIINTMPIPSEIVRMGLGEKYDYLSFLNRLAQFDNADECWAYANKPEARVFRIRPSKPAALDPFPTPELLPRGTGKTEMALSDAMNDLREAILAKYSDAYDAEELATTKPIPEGFEAIQDGVNAIGDNRDTTYLASDTFILTKNSETFLIAYGVNHQATGKATYSNLAVYGTKYFNGVAGVSNLSFPGSAEYYIPGHDKADYLYAWKVARNAGGHPYALEVPFATDCYGIGYAPATIAFRAYLEPETKTGPAYVELLHDRVIKFTPKN